MEDGKKNRIVNKMELKIVNHNGEIVASNLYPMNLLF